MSIAEGFEKLAAYHAEAEALRSRYNDSWTLTHDAKCPTCRQHVKTSVAKNKRHDVVAEETDLEKVELRRRMLADPAVSRLVCDKTVMFQANDSFKEWNYGLESLLCKTFHRGVGDSESGQGWFYVPSDMADEVVSFLANKATDVEVDDNDHLIVNWSCKEDRASNNIQ